MTTDPGSPQSRTVVRDADNLPEQSLFQNLTVAFCLLSAATAIVGIFMARLGVVLTPGAGNKMIALSAALIWIFISAVLAYRSMKSLHRFAGIALQTILLLIVLAEAIEFVFSVQGSHFFIETFFVGLGTVFIGPASGPISPVAAALAVVAALAVLLVVRSDRTAGENSRQPDAIAIPGWLIVIVSFTFVMSYAYGNPLLYGTPYIPIAFVSALAALFTGAALVAAAGPVAMPARYFIGDSIQADLLRVFVPLVIGVALVENITFVGLSSLFGVRDAVLLSAILVVFVFVTALVIGRISGRMGSALDRAEQELSRKNGELGAANEELTATQEELRQNIDELTSTENTLRESEERFRTIAQVSPVMLSITRKSDGVILFANPAYERAFGFGSGESSGRNAQDLYFDPVDRQAILAIFRTNGSVENHEVRVKRKDGTPFWVDVSLRQIRYLGDDALIAATVDITPRKTAEQELTKKNDDLSALNEELTATQEELRQTVDDLSVTERGLRESESRLRRFYDSGLIGVIYWNMQGGITDANDKFLEITGFTREDLVTGQIDWIAMTPPEFRHRDEESARELSTTGVNAKPFEKEYVRKDGTRVPVLVAGAMLDDARENGVAFVLDITVRRLAEKAMQDSEDRMRFALETSHTGAWDLDLMDHTAFRSLEHDRVFGYPDLLPEWTYEMFLDHVVTEDRGMVDEKFQHAMETHGDWSFECRIRRADGEIRWIWAAGRHRTSAYGSSQRMAGIVQDITERKQLEENIQLTLQRFYRVLAGMPYGILLVTDDNRVEFANQAFCDIFDLGESPEQLPGLTAREVLGKIRPAYTEPDNALARIGETVLLGEPVRGEEIRMSRDRTFLRDFIPIYLGEKRTGRLWVHIEITKRKKAEAALRESEERFRLALKNAPVSVSLQDKDLVYRWAYNQTTRRTDEIVGKTDADLFAPEDVEWLTPLKRRMFETGEEVHTANWLTSNCRRVYLDLFFEPMRNASGEIYGIGIAAVNLTDQKHAEAALRESEEKFRSVLDNSRDFIYRLNLQTGVYEYVSPSVKVVLGYTPEEFAALDPGAATATVHPDDLAALLESLKTLESIGLADLEYRIRNRRGEYLWISNVLWNTNDTTGRPLYRGGSVRDITARKQAEEALNQKNENLNALNEELYATEEELRRNLEELSIKEAMVNGLSEQRQLALDAAGMGWWHYDPETRMASYDRRYREIFSVMGEACLNDEILATRMHPDDLPGVWEKVEKALNLRDPQPYSATYRIRLPDRTIRWVEAHGIGLFEGTGRTRRATGLIGTVADITRRKNAEDELKRRHEDLNAAYEEITATQEELRQNIDELTVRELELNKALVEKEVLLSEIHHRVKNNLTAFISLLSLEGSTEDSPAGKLLKLDLQNRARSMALVHETLYRTNMYDEVDMELYLTTLTDQIANSFQTTRSVKTIVAAHGVMLDIPRATPAGLIINELITNSFKYAFPDSFDPYAERDAPPTITIALSRYDGMYELTFRDNGVGLPPGVDLATTKTLGLKLVNFLARHQLRAKIEVNTRCGTEFVFRFKE